MFKVILLVTICISTLLSKELILKKGKNTIVNNFGSIDVEKTFKSDVIQKVEVYDDISKRYAVYPFDIKDQNILDLKAIENKVKYIVYAIKDISIKLHFSDISKSCKKFIQDNSYNVIYDSGIDKSYTMNKKDSISISSRYYSNQYIKQYTDTNVALIYPKLKKTTKMNYKYGPAEPKVYIKFSKEYEGKVFYIYDYLLDSCYKGIFPSPQVPPFSLLRKVK